MAGRLEKTNYTGVYRSHSRTCGWREGSCSCDEHYEAAVYSRRDGKVIRKHFGRKTEARTWREDVRSALRRGPWRRPRR